MEDMNKKQSWIKTVRSYKLENINSSYTIAENTNNYDQKINLNENYESYEKNILKTQLLPHQKITVQAMIDLETIRYVNLKFDEINDINREYIDNYLKPVIETTAGIVSEKPGSGKTYEIFALLANKHNMPKYTEITSIPMPKISKVPFHYRNKTFTDMGFTYEVRKNYRKTYKQTLVFVGKSVLSQWVERFQKYTDFKVFVINDIFNLRDYYDLMFNKNNAKKINKYDIILIKNGTIAGKFDVPELKNSYLQKIKSKAILNIFGELFKDCCFERVVLDDFDTLSIPTNATVIPAGFTWFISATKKIPPGKRNIIDYYNTEDILRSYRPTYVNIWNNKELFTFFNIGCDNTFIDKSTNASMIEYYVYRFNNPNDNFIGLIGNMGANNAPIAEMLNGDAIATAAHAVGLKSNSVADIFEKILDKSWNIYKKNVEIEQYIPKAKKIINDLPILSDENNSISQTNISNLRKNIKKPGPLKSIKSFVKHQQMSVLDLIQDIESTNKQEKDENGKSIQRVKDNLKQGECPITCELLSECSAIVVMRCCGTAISKEGAEMAFSKSNSTCMKCRSIVSMDSLILIDRDIETINKILNEDIIDSVDDENIDSDNLEDTAEVNIEKNKIEDKYIDEIDFELDEPEIDNNETLNKFNCIIKIIQGQISDIEHVQEHRRDILIPNLLEGSYDAGTALPHEKKVIIYTNYNETMTNLEQRLSRKNISYAKLHGSVNQIKEIHRRYWLDNEDPDAFNVLLINGPKYCAGLDLQNTTDLIFSHKVIDPNVETQIAGRGARYGRKKNLNIHYVLYENEYILMFGRNRIARG